MILSRLRYTPFVAAVVVLLLARAGRCVHNGGSGTGHDNRATYHGSDYADTDRRTHCHRDASANPHSASDRDANAHSTSYRDANTVPNCYADTNTHSRTAASLQAGHASRTHGLHLVGMEL